jgi:hypothetical protein
MINRVLFQPEKHPEKRCVDQQCVVINCQNPDEFTIIWIAVQMLDQRSEFRLKSLVLDRYPFPQPLHLFLILHEVK